MRWEKPCNSGRLRSDTARNLVPSSVGEELRLIWQAA
jgi:hypothetical protein